MGLSRPKPPSPDPTPRKSNPYLALHLSLEIRRDNPASSLRDDSVMNNETESPRPISKLDGHPIEDDDMDEDDQRDDDIREDEGIIRCICRNTEDDGYTVQCDNCLVWQHVACVFEPPIPDSDHLPDTYICEKCDPRGFTKHPSGLACVAISLI
ncbi:uncharacterized protein BJ171DRAFT_212065 [Polychytrium aggregatum]|uniref:uncharacterized protein n=1 Tax=Polychytrium aggregatum TaxID=110093 RepID=UPI0022FEF9C8|nr:uncharacterized protein BJ171DRAFT_212065 [Polychytrium aggregatum]KAI9208687.1 hypothetical protein BJ171DRAFT_212065 [Polychytrium aggregatum]